ncbi:dethiobiotin synthase [Pseudidiomarina homiensis]|uniref:ATP-dependent dethiobiotin synthetase BioD n=1 Tax=Pseudidiomarina homiensis TaxID=364198 RepID=A0A432Y4A9_9GAMM|nr:dethiobiotin synthase [Pseudidiomarina homiensis]RUO55746.1 dethiobiotin synthase [Pseudidiomarina homiensis]
MTCVFVTGTDTDVGKTLVSAALLERLAEGHFRTLAMKPVAAGADATVAGLRNSDALQLEQAMTCGPVAYEAINPICLSAPVAPHLAAQQQGIDLTVADLKTAHEQLTDVAHDLLLIEGAGGWLVPLNATESLADFATAVHGNIVLVVGMRLGCLNHALLTAADIHRRGLNLVGWVANQAQPEAMALADENELWLAEYLETHYQAPLLASIPFQKTANPKAVAGYFPASQELMSLLRGSTAL